MDLAKFTHPPAVPLEFSGKWIAWDRKREAILASGRTVTEALQASILAGEPKPILAKVPKADVPLVRGRL